jgi:hypothetical protein
MGTSKRIATDDEFGVYGASLAVAFGWHQQKNPAGCPAGFKSILVGRLEETNRTISTRFCCVRFRVVMPDINMVNG